LDIQVAEVKPSQLSEWLAIHEGRLKNTSYNRYAGFLKQVFQIALNDGIIARNTVRMQQMQPISWNFWGWLDWVKQKLPRSFGKMWIGSGTA
jgi:hypothetical protein